MVVQSWSSFFVQTIILHHRITWSRIEEAFVVEKTFKEIKHASNALDSVVFIAGHHALYKTSFTKLLTLVPLAKPLKQLSRDYGKYTLLPIKIRLMYS